MSEAPTPGPPSTFHPPDLMHEAVGPSPELTKKNTNLTIALVILCLVLFAGTFAVGLLYRHLT